MLRLPFKTNFFPPHSRHSLVDRRNEKDNEIVPVSDMLTDGELGVSDDFDRTGYA